MTKTISDMAVSLQRTLNETVLEFDEWWRSQFWIDAYTEDDRLTALAAWRACATTKAPADEKLIFLRGICDEAERNGWQHVSIATLRAGLGGK